MGTSPQSEELRIFFSTTNSIFFLLAIAYFDYGPDRFKVLQVKKSSQIILALAGLVIFLCELVLFTRIENPRNVWIYLPDFLLSLFTLSVLAYSMFQSFYNRDMKPIAFLSIPVIVLILFAQMIRIPVWKAFFEHFFSNSLGLTYPGYIFSHIETLYQVALLVLFLVLYISWLRQKIRFPETKSLYIKFNRLAGNGNKSLRVELLLPGLYNQRVEKKLSPKPFKNLLVLAKNRVLDEKTGNSEEGFRFISELYSLVGKHTPAHQNIARIRAPLGIPKEKYGILIENDSNGKYRLRISPENIEIDPELFKHPSFRHILDPLAKQGEKKASLLSHENGQSTVKA